MAYKISGTKSTDARIVVIKQSDWTVESSTVISGSGAYEVDSLIEGDKLVVAMTDEGEAIAYGFVSGIEYASPPGDRGVFAGGYISGSQNIIDYITISSSATAQDFGDLTLSRENLTGASNGSYDRGIFAGGLTNSDVIDYITISSIGNAIDFGNLSLGRFKLAAADNGINQRIVFAGGNNSGAQSVIDYIAANSLGNASAFGNLTSARYSHTGTSNSIYDRGLFAGAYGYSTIIEYITISSTGNSTDFGDLTLARHALAGTSNGTNNRAIFGGGLRSGPADTNVIDYTAINSLGNAFDFGDLATDNYYMGACSNKVNNRGVFGGGWTREDIVQYVTISSLGNATHYSNLSVYRRELAACSNA